MEFFSSKLGEIEVSRFDDSNFPLAFLEVMSHEVKRFRGKTTNRWDFSGVLPPAEMVQAQRVSMAAEVSCPKLPEGMAV